MIRNDRWIIQQSTPPKFVVTKVTFAGTGFDAQSLQLSEIVELSWHSEDELRQLVELHQNATRDIVGNYALGVKSFRPVRPEDLERWQPMIEPFTPQQTREEVRDNGTTTRERVISYGVSSFGYDVRIADEFMIFTNVNSVQVDPKSFNEKSFVRFQGDVCVIPPNSFVLARSLEYFRMPRNVSGLVLGKSTYARCGVNCIATPLEPGWEGHITLEYINGTPLPARLYANEGAAQVQFFEGDAPLVSYADRGGKYQGQRGITLPKA